MRRQLREVIETTEDEAQALGIQMNQVYLSRFHRDTLDLCGRGEFTLFSGIGGESWVKAAEVISDGGGGVQVGGYTIGFRRDYINCYRDWERVRGVGESGVVLVRPDHFVAWRCREVVERPLDKLQGVLRTVLGLERSFSER